MHWLTACRAQVQYRKPAVAHANTPILIKPFSVRPSMRDGARHFFKDLAGHSSPSTVQDTCDTAHPTPLTFLFLTAQSDQTLNLLKKAITLSAIKEVRQR
jgi:hypothetical protein